MCKQTPYAVSPLGGYFKDFGHITLSEVVDMAIVSIAFPIYGSKALQNAFIKTYETPIPESGNSSISKDGRFRFLKLQPGLIFALYDFEGKHPVNVIKNQIGQSGLYTDQSDSWMLLRLAGSRLAPALERMCPLDLSPHAFGPGCVARTIVEHLNTIILCENLKSFLFMSPRSSAYSFLNNFETSIEITLK